MLIQHPFSVELNRIVAGVNYFIACAEQITKSVQLDEAVFIFTSSGQSQGCWRKDRIQPAVTLGLYTHRHIC